MKNLTRTQAIANLAQQVENLKTQIKNKNNKRYTCWMRDEVEFDCCFAKVQRLIIEEIELQLKQLKINNDQIFDDVFKLMNSFENWVQRTEVFDENHNIIKLSDFFEKTSEAI